MSGNEGGVIQYVNSSFVAGTSASSPGVPRHMYGMNAPFSMPSGASPKLEFPYNFLPFKIGPEDDFGLVHSPPVAEYYWQRELYGGGDFPLSNIAGGGKEEGIY